ncbi:MAG: hypothetical protein LUH04_17870 [Clostridium sp.]|nr:hypothetical protein [Clostridium sp.]
MAYFDSPKNRVLWEMELKDLRRQKVDFAAGRLHDYTGVQKDDRGKEALRRPVTLEQLEREEAASKSNRREAAKPREREREIGPEKTRERSRDAPPGPRAPLLKSNHVKGR